MTVDIVKVKSAAELKDAVSQKAEVIEIMEDELAKRILKLKQVKKLTKWGLAVLCALAAGGTGVVVMTGGTGILAVAPAAGATGVAMGLTAAQITAIIWLVAIAGLTVVTLFAIWRGYDIVEVEYEKGKVRYRLVKKGVDIKALTRTTS